MLKKIARLILPVIMILLFVGEGGFNIISYSQSSTDTTLGVTNSGLILGQFEINPERIFIDEDLVFSLSNIRYGSGSIAIGLICNMFLEAPDGSTIELEMVVSTAGTCNYDTSLSLVAQNITLVSGDISLLNSILGFGDGFVIISLDGQDYTSNTDIYEVIELQDLELENPFFEIVPEKIFAFDELNFNLTQARFTNGQIASNLVCRLFLTPAPGNRPEVVISGITDQNGDCRFVLEKQSTSFLGGVQADAQQTFNLESGTLSDLHSRVGAGSGYGEVYYNDIAYRSNLDDYSVSIQDIPEIIIRTGGEYAYVIILVVLALVSGGIYISLRKKESE